MPSTIILASGSEIRQTMLRNAGVVFESKVARIDETTIKKALIAEGTQPRDMADVLAELKGKKISSKFYQSLVIGCDQILDLGGETFSKPEIPAEAVMQLKHLRGKPHKLWSAAVIYEYGEPIWRHVGQAQLTMRQFSDSYLNEYVDRNWEEIRHCVGGYQIESEGVRLFSRLSGDYFSILGMPLVEILNFLALRGVIEE